CCLTQLPQLQPMMMRSDPFDGSAEVPEEVTVDVAEPRPVPKFDSQLETRLGLPHEVAFVDAEKPVQCLNDRHARLADTHDADLIRLNEPDGRVLGFEKTSEDGGRHPAGRPPSDDYDFSNTGCHIAPPSKQRAHGDREPPIRIRPAIPRRQDGATNVQVGTGVQ